MSKLVVDIHTHLYPSVYLDALRARTELPKLIPNPDGGDDLFVIFPGEPGRPMGEEYSEVARKIAFMDQHGIDQSVVSLGNPWLDPLTDMDTVALARELNAQFAGLEGETGGRVVGMGVLPATNVADAAEVAGEIAESDTLYGVVTGSRICGLRFDDEGLDPLWSVLESTGLPLLLHPHYGLGMEELLGFDHALPVGLAFPFETTTAIARMIFGGVYERFPKLKVCASHGGGALPFLAGRLDAAWHSDPVVQERLPVVPSERLKNLFLDALTYHPRSMRATEDLVGAGQMAFGTDHPFSVSDPAANLAGLREAFEGDAFDAVMNASAIEYFGLPELGQANGNGRR
jgi:predicted TIM-barrel fold metal-dependent hydrolase